MRSPFLFTVCQVGAEPALKKEIAQAYPALRFSFSRPGFVTFKGYADGFAPDFKLQSIFARAYGCSLKQVAEDSLIPEVSQLAETLLAEMPPEARLRLHVWERDQYPAGEAPQGFQFGALSRQAESEIHHAVKTLDPDCCAEIGDYVIDVTWIDPRKWNLGFHQHSAFHSSWPGGETPIAEPSGGVPSRAYYKLEEALRWSGAKLDRSDIAVEIGSAPGGASWALLQRGLRVVGIDPADMDSRVLRHRDFKHVKQVVASVAREDLPEQIQWLLLDMNIEPRISLFAVSRLALRMQESLLGVLLTVKLNQWSVADDIPSMFEHLKEMGMIKVRAAQLSRNRQEIFIFGLTRKGTLRR